MSDGQREPSLRDSIVSAMETSTTETPAAAPEASSAPTPSPAAPAVAPSGPKVGSEAAPTDALKGPQDPKAAPAPTADGRPAVDAPARIPPAPPGFDLKEWSAAPDAVRNWIRQRETGFNQAWQKQSQQAKFGASLWNELKPYEATLRASGIQPAQLVAEFAATHELLSRGTQEQKQQAILRVMQRYGIDMSQAGQLQPEGEQPHPRVAQLEKAVMDMRNLLLGREQQSSQQEAQQIWGNLDGFAKDPQNEFFPHLWERMAHLIETGAAQGRSQDEVLRNAYRTAMYERDDIRAILTDRDAARRTREAQAARQASTTGGASPIAGGTAIQSDSLRGTIEAAWDKAA